ncbi:thiamine pyrophosphate-binding protein [Paracraurococcus ruber]|uniref:thiamine pyrophosphate-binding protein n=1 Tax=Paracraurococcus ruber TaxID=77675 RepID=UPI0019031750|nr:thiamine pyrophosphate-binding protein [Paracraurococcus ruber]
MAETMTVRQATMALLREHGMTTVFGNPGSTELGFLDRWPNDIRYVLGLQEASVVAMADGFARATGRPALCNLHSAAGVGHALGNVFTAFRNQAPVVITAGQQARGLLPGNPFLGATEAASFPKPYVKWSCEPARAEDVPAALAHAVHLAAQRPQGPTFVSIPSDDWQAPTRPLPPRRVSQDVAPDPALLADCAQALAAARNPVLVIGPEVDAEGAGDAAVALAEKLCAPVWASPFSARLSFPEDHALFAGHLAAAPPAVSNALAAHDLVLVLGVPSRNTCSTPCRACCRRMRWWWRKRPATAPRCSGTCRSGAGAGSTPWRAAAWATRFPPRSASPSRIRGAASAPSSATGR